MSMVSTYQLNLLESFDPLPSNPNLTDPMSMVVNGSLEDEDPIRLVQVMCERDSNLMNSTCLKLLFSTLFLLVLHPYEGLFVILHNIPVRFHLYFSKF